MDEVILENHGQTNPHDEIGRKIVQFLSSKSQVAAAIIELINDTFGLSYFLLIPIMALVSWMPFPKNRLFLGEHTIIHTYIVAVWNFALALSFIILSFYSQLLEFLLIIYATGYFYSLLLIYKSLSRWTWAKTSMYVLLVFSVGMALFIFSYFAMITIGFMWKVYEALIDSNSI